MAWSKEHESLSKGGIPITNLLATFDALSLPL